MRNTTLSALLALSLFAVPAMAQTKAKPAAKAQTASSASTIPGLDDPTKHTAKAPETFKVQFEIPATYPATPIEIELPELDGKTAKMYRGGKICLDIHFAPLWRSMVPKYGVVHSLCYALGPWLAAEIPYLVECGVIVR